MRKPVPPRPPRRRFAGIGSPYTSVSRRPVSDAVAICVSTVYRLPQPIVTNALLRIRVARAGLLRHGMVMTCPTSMWSGLAIPLCAASSG